MYKNLDQLHICLCEVRQLRSCHILRIRFYSKFDPTLAKMLFLFLNNFVIGSLCGCYYEQIPSYDFSI